MVKSPDVLVMIFDEVSSSKWNFYNRKSPARSIFTLILHAAYSFVPNCKVVVCVCVGGGGGGGGGWIWGVFSQNLQFDRLLPLQLLTKE